MTKDELALFLYEQCQDRTKPLAGIVQAVADKAGVSPHSIDDVVRRYKQSGTGLEEAASKILGNTVQDEIVLHSVDIVSPVQPAGRVIAVSNAIQPAGFAIHNGVVVNLDQARAKVNAVDSTIQELKGIPISQEYFDSRAKQLFGEVSYELRNLAESINNEGRVFDLALVQPLPKENSYSRTSFLYNGVKYSGWKMQTDEQIERERVEQEQIKEKAKIEKENRLAEQDRLMESLGFDKFDEPEKCYQVYCMLKHQAEENEEQFSFDINLLSEEGCGNIFYYDSEEFKVVDDNELWDLYYEQETEYISQNPHDYVYDACTSEMIERTFSYDAETYESDNGHYHVIKE